MRDHRRYAYSVWAASLLGADMIFGKDTSVRRRACLHRQRLRSPVVALSLGGLRRRIEALLLPDEVRVVLQLDGFAERERHRRQA